MPVIGVQAGFVLGGAVYIETVFQWPGIGRMLVKAISTRDILLVQGGVLVVAASYVLFNLLADVAQQLARPADQGMSGRSSPSPTDRGQPASAAVAVARQPAAGNRWRWSIALVALDHAVAAAGRTRT